MALDFTTDDGIGSGATFGLIVLQADETIEYEARQLIHGDDIAIYHSRIVMPSDVNPATLASMEAELPRSAALLPEIDFDVIGYCCTSGATVIGSEGVAASIRGVHPEAKVTDPIAAVVAACRELDICRLGFVTPYVADVSAAMRALLESKGIRIAGFDSFEQGDDRVVARITPASVMQAVKSVNAMEECDAVFVACTNLRVSGIAGEAEEIIGKPVISSNLALLWHMQRLAGITPCRPGYGSLFSSRPS